MHARTPARLLAPAQAALDEEEDVRAPGEPTASSQGMARSIEGDACATGAASHDVRGREGVQAENLG